MHKFHIGCLMGGNEFFDLGIVLDAELVGSVEVDDEERDSLIGWLAELAQLRPSSIKRLLQLSLKLVGQAVVQFQQNWWPGPVCPDIYL